MQADIVMPRGESERKHSLASIEPSDPLYEDVDVGGKKKRVRVSVKYIPDYPISLHLRLRTEFSPCISEIDIPDFLSAHVLIYITHHPSSSIFHLRFRFRFRPRRGPSRKVYLNETGRSYRRSSLGRIIWIKG